jgi:hypothetical protein
MQATVPATAILMYGMGILSILMGLGFVFALIKNLDISRWVKFALFGILLVLSSEAFTLALSLLAGRVLATSALFQLLFLGSVLRFLGQLLFIVGISATLFDARNQLRIAHAMLNKPASHDLD